jgi:hypothetical protein
MIGLERPREFVGDRRHLVGRLLAVERRIQVDAFRATRHRESLEPHSGQNRAYEFRDLDAFREPRALTGVEIEHEPVGVLARPTLAEPPLRNVQFERCLLRHPGQSRQIVDEGIGVDVIGVLDVAA